ncbi:MAG: ferredoxin [Planctomycetaceae bacterium]|nr:ferredoxin [Planctomycetaceae bacterium]
MQEAPHHFAYDGDNHCYVCRQPQSGAETTDMIGTAWMAEFECIRYRGNDPDVLRRLAELDLRRICDIEPPSQIIPVIRNHVRITIIGTPATDSSQQLAKEFINHLASQNNEWRQFKTKTIRSSANASSLEFAWYEDHFHPILFASIPDSASEWHIEYPLKNDLGDRGVGNVVSYWLNCNEGRFTNIRWYTDSDWHGDKSWQSTPW